MNIPIQGISISQTDEVIHVQSEEPLVILSSAIIGGGFSRICHILNAHVDKNFNTPNPKDWLRSLAARMDIHESFIGLMTAVKLSKARITFLESDGLSVGALVTAGVRNASAAGITPVFSSIPGTINIILLLNARLTRAAMLNAVITATETKTAVLMEKKFLRLKVILPPAHPPTPLQSQEQITALCKRTRDPSRLSVGSSHAPCANRCKNPWMRNDSSLCTAL
jgi:iron complex transport system ATP-binding protein